MRKEYSGNARETFLANAGGISATDMEFTTDSATGFPDGSVGPFVVALSLGETNEEKVLVASRAGMTFTVQERGYDGTTPSSHNVNAPVAHVLDATTLDEANNHANNNTDDVHTQYAKLTGDVFTGQTAITPPTSALPYGTVVEQPGTNFVTNPSFEVDTTGWSVVGASTLTRESDVDAPIGDYRLTVSIPTGANTDGTLHDAVAAVAGDDVTASVWLASPEAPKTVRLDLQFLDSAGAVISGGGVTANVDVGTSYSRYVINGTAPANTASARLVIRNNNTDQGAWSIWVDGVQVELLSFETSYMDGSLGPGYSWQGTAHASASDRAGGLHVLDDSGNAQVRTLEVLGGPAALRIRPRGDHAYLEIYARSATPNARSAYIGFGSTGTDQLTIHNQLGGKIRIFGEQITIPDGAETLPSLAFAADADTGIFTRVANHIMFATGGVETAYISDGGAFRSNDGTAAEPAFSFRSDVDTGIYLPTAGTIDFACGGVVELRLNSGYLHPFDDGIKNLGASNYRWQDIYATNGTIQTSDETAKNELKKTSLGRNFVNAVRPSEFTFKGGRRIHQGFSAQQVKQALSDIGVEDSAVYIDPAVAAQAQLDAGPPESITSIEDDDEREEAESQWREELEAELNSPKGLRYSELIPPLYKAFQEQQEEIDTMRAEKTALEATVADLVARVEALESK